MSTSNISYSAIFYAKDIEVIVRNSYTEHLICIYWILVCYFNTSIDYIK